jgi:hypothetical protein
MGKERSLVPIAFSNGMGWARSALPILRILSGEDLQYRFENLQYRFEDL